MAASSITALRRRLAVIFDDEAPHTHQAAAARRMFNAALAVLIVVNVAAIVLESVESIDERYLGLFGEIERIATAIFTAEYLLRVWTAVDVHHGAFRDPLFGRLRYMRGFFPIIDLISILPAALGLFGAGDLRVLRLLRLLRMLKLTRHSAVFSLLWAVLREEAHTIGAIIFIISLTVTVSGALMYMIEGGDQPTVFTSIPASMWWAIETLTTVGYGDMVPETTAGKTLGGIISVVGIGTLALFSGLITASFLDQLKLRRESARQHRLVDASLPFCPHCGRPMHAIERNFEVTSTAE
jgi:voltage-gated potassium channel